MHGTKAVIKIKKKQTSPVYIHTYFSLNNDLH